MVKAKLYCICGNCGSDSSFTLNVDRDPDTDFLEVSMTCEDCATIHWLEDNCK